MTATGAPLSRWRFQTLVLVLVLCGSGSIDIGIGIGSASAGPASRFANLTDCPSCVAAGYGWSTKKQRCGGYIAKACPDDAVPASPAGAAQAQPAAAAAAAEQQLYGLLPVSGEVERIEWDHADPDFASTLALRGKPVVLLNSPHLKSWAAPGKWTPNFLAKTVRRAMQFSHNPGGRNFLFYQARGQDTYNSSVDVWQAPSGYKSLTIKEFNKVARKAMKRKPKEFLYYYKNVGPNTPFRDLLNDISPYTWFVVDRDQVVSRQRGGPARRGRGGQATAVMWFGMKGVRSTIHYDESYNFYVQIFGTKRWFFAPPTYYSSCYLYPMAHPSSRQCQLDWPHRDVARFPRATSNGQDGNGSEGGAMELLTTVLAAEEVLFIPPAWFHATEALDTNLALNYWTKGINAQTHWMDYSLECDKQWKAMQPILTLQERKATLLDTLFRVTAAGLLKDSPSTPNVGARWLALLAARAAATPQQRCW
jgi:hypothetical protein